MKIPSLSKYKTILCKLINSIINKNVNLIQFYQVQKKLGKRIYSITNEFFSTTINEIMNLISILTGT